MILGSDKIRERLIKNQIFRREHGIQQFHKRSILRIADSQ